MSPATWQQAPRLLATRRICCSLREVEVRRRRRGRVDELEARELEVADVRIPRAQRRSEVRRVLLVLRRRRVVERRRDRRRRAVGLLHVLDGRRRVVEVDPLVGGEVVVDRRARTSRPRCRCRRESCASTVGRVAWPGSCRRTPPRRSVWMTGRAVGQHVEADRLVQVRRSRRRWSAGSWRARSRRSRCRRGRRCRPSSAMAPVEVLREVRVGEARRRDARAPCRTSGRPGSPCTRRPGGRRPSCRRSRSAPGSRAAGERLLDDGREHVADSRGRWCRSCTSGRSSSSTRAGPCWRRGRGRRP